MPALDDQIDDLFETYFYHVTTPEMWEQIKNEGLKPDKDGIIRALTTNCRDIVDHYATRHFGAAEIVVIRFNPCNLGIYPQRDADACSPPADGYIKEIRAKIIGPLLLEKESERKIEHHINMGAPPDP
ncbi:MAG: hypothetical protein V1766_15160 [Pseudomonadota bacterium]